MSSIFHFSFDYFYAIKLNADTKNKFASCKYYSKFKKILFTETQVFTFFMGIFFLFINYRNGFYLCYKINFI